PVTAPAGRPRLPPADAAVCRLTRRWPAASAESRRDEPLAPPRKGGPGGGRDCTCPWLSGPWLAGDVRRATWAADGARERIRGKGRAGREARHRRRASHGRGPRPGARTG